MKLLALSFAGDPQSSLLAGASWTERLVLGPFGTSLAVIAVAWFGLEMLGGRLSPKRGGQLALGCFILFSAPAIARAFMGLAQQENEGAPQVQAQVIPAPPPPVSPPARTNPNPFDPYAGAPGPTN